MENLRAAEMNPSDAVLQVRHLSHAYRLSRKAVVRALDDVSFSVERGEIFGLVGESGSGKSTCARCIMGIERPQAGKILFEGINVLDSHSIKEHREILQADRQLIFQDSASSLNQRMRVEDVITEPLKIHRRKPGHGATLREEAAWQLARVGMDEQYLDQYPSGLSGGQRQRVAIARALSMDPSLLVADEPLASLDLSIQAQVVNLFLALREELHFSLLFIAHDLAMVEFLCDRVGVMAHGRMLEIAPAKELFGNPAHPYTQLLIDSIPVPDPLIEKNRKYMDPDALQYDPNVPLREICPGHFAAV